MHYEGGLILLDHGQGLISAYLHLSKVGVGQGQMVDKAKRSARSAGKAAPQGRTCAGA